MTKLENQSLDRGIRLLEIMAREGACTLADLHAHSGIPKSSIRRLLGTLTERRLVRRSLSDRRYRVNIFLPASTGQPIAPGTALIIDVAMPHLIELTKQVGWPSDAHVIDGTRMLLVDSTRPFSPFHLYRGVVNRQLSIFGSATGQICLAHMEEEAIADIHRQTEGDPRWGLRRFGITLRRYMETIHETRDRGYGVRLGNYLGETILNDGLAAIAVPLFIEHRPVGAVTLLWPRVYREHQAFAEEHLPPLKATAARINKDLRHFSV